MKCRLAINLKSYSVNRDIVRIQRFWILYVVGQCLYLQISLFQYLLPLAQQTNVFINIHSVSSIVLSRIEISLAKVPFKEAIWESFVQIHVEITEHKVAGFWIRSIESVIGFIGWVIG